MQVLIVSIIFGALLAGAQIESKPMEVVLSREERIIRLGPPLPPIERFPDRPYIAPPTPEEKAEAKAEREALAAIRERRQAAVAQILSQAAIVTNGLSKVELAEARAQVLEAAATVTSKGSAKLSLVSAVAVIKEGGGVAIKPIEGKEVGQ